jgi:hypothetical protein
MPSKSRNSLVEDIPSLLKTASNCLNVARRHRKPLTGKNDYAHKFLDLKAKSVLLSKGLQQQIASIENKDAQNAAIEIEHLLNVFFNPATIERSETHKKIIFLYKTAIEPVLSIAPKHSPRGELFPLGILNGAPDYIEHIGRQANGCFEQGWYDASAVMLRRLLETLIIECYENYSIADSIKNKDGNFLYLRDLISHFLSETCWNPTRNTKNALPKLKDIGDLSAHSRRHIAQKQDITNVQKELRVVIQELVYLAGFEKRKPRSVLHP